jgi:hypothetical protein
LGQKSMMNIVMKANVLYGQWGEEGCTQEVKVFFFPPPFQGWGEVIDHHIAHGICSKPLLEVVNPHLRVPNVLSIEFRAMTLMD